jgi:heme/copper-type cytochrome/quinol oxidase subunit 1
MHYKGYQRYGLEKELWQKFNFEEGFSTTDAPERTAKLAQQFILGFMGMPRRYASYPEEFQVLNIFSTAGASILAIGVIMPAIYLTYALFKGKIAGDNPWLLHGLEWRTTSPPPTGNFENTPTVTWEAYDYSDKNGLSELVEERRQQGEIITVL